MDAQDLVTELRDLREQVPGVAGTLVAALDGQLVAADLDLGSSPRVDLDSLAGIAAASLGIAQRVTGLAGQGTLGQAVTHANDGQVAVYAVGDAALLAVLGAAGLDLDELHRKSGPARSRIHAILAEQNAGA
jgi:predicted regulator of Ras-like GTPase activity (Roadblock/LC7/MglB family)